MVKLMDHVREVDWATATPGESKDKQLNAQGQSSALLFQMHGLVAPDP